MWLITLFLCRHQWDLWLFIAWTQSQKEAESSRDDSGTACLCQKLPCTPGQQAGTFWKVILQANIPFEWTRFATPSTDEWSEADSKGFLWEVSPEGLKAVGKGKLRLGKQQALGSSKCFLCLPSRVFIFSVVCCQDSATTSKSRSSIAD